MGWATGYSGRWESRFDFQSVGLSFSCPALVTDKAKRVEPVPGSKGIKKAPALSPEASSRMLKSREASPDAPTLSQSTDHTRATKSLSKKCRSLSKKCKSSHPPAFRIIGPRARSEARLYSHPGKEMTRSPSTSTAEHGVVGWLARVDAPAAMTCSA